MTRRDLVGIGSMVVDELHRVPRLIGPDEKITVRETHRVVGGVTLNHLAWARVLGLRVGLFGKQADDDAGRFIRAAATRLGLELDLRLDGAASSVSHVFIDAAGERSIYMAPGATAETTVADLARHADFLASADAVSTEVSQLPLATVVAVLRGARARGARTFLDVDVPPSAAVRSLGSEAELAEAIALADVLKPTAAAARELAGDGLLEAVAARLHRGRRLVAITDGAAGCVLCDGAAQAFPPPPATVLDTTGAGDAFFGGLVAGVQRGLALPAIAALANACGSACVELLGAVPDASAPARIAARVPVGALPAGALPGGGRA